MMNGRPDRTLRGPRRPGAHGRGVSGRGFACSVSRVGSDEDDRTRGASQASDCHLRRYRAGSPGSGPGQRAATAGGRTHAPPTGGGSSSRDRATGGVHHRDWVARVCGYAGGGQVRPYLPGPGCAADQSASTTRDSVHSPEPALGGERDSALEPNMGRAGSATLQSGGRRHHDHDCDDHRGFIGGLSLPNTGWAKADLPIYCRRDDGTRARFWRLDVATGIGQRPVQICDG